MGLFIDWTPDFLVSRKTAAELEPLYKDIISRNRFELLDVAYRKYVSETDSVYKNKYIKYKTKYLNLKNSMM